MIDKHTRGGVVLLALGTAWLLIGSACNSTAPAPVLQPQPGEQKQKVLRVGVSETAPPLIFLKDDEPAGIEADLARQLAEALGRELQFVSIYWPDLIHELRDGRIDIIMAGMSVTDQRKRRVAFTEPYLVVGQKAMIRAKDEETLGTTGAILVTSRKVGVEKGSTGESFAHSDLPRAKVFAMPTLEKAIEALIAKQIDVVIYDSTSVQWMAGKHKDAGLMAVPGLFTTESLAWAIDKENIGLLNEVNGVLNDWKESGTLKETLARWLPDYE